MAAADEAYKHLQKRGSYSPKDLGTEQPYKALIVATTAAYSPAIEDNKIPDAMARSLAKDTHVFSGLKTHAQLLEASKMLRNDAGQVKSFQQFSQDIKTLKADYNEHYLEAEYQFAKQSAIMAGKWAGFAEGAGRYNLQYRTAGDTAVRISHQVLANTTLPYDDAFWSLYYPPNGWRCRCTVMEVRKGSYEESDSDTAQAAGNKATTQLDKNGNNKLAMFRFNPGKDEKIFPPKNPYTKVVGAATAKAIVEKQATPNKVAKWKIDKPVTSISDLTDVVRGHAKMHPENFARGFADFKIESNPRNNGSTDMRGRILLSKPRMELVIDAFNSIRKKAKTSYAQEDALSTLWHEILHNRNKVGNEYLTTDQRKSMELANEFVSRNTLPDFIESLGGKLQHKELMTDRGSTGYNTMVRNYDQLIEWCGADKKSVVESVSKHLFEASYKEQMKGLIDAISEHSEYKLKEVRQLVSQAKSYSTKSFKAYLETRQDLLVKKKS